MLSEARLNSLLQGQTAVAIKVFNAVPMGEAWSINQIERELARTGIQQGRRVVEACLERLVEQKIIKRAGPDAYVRQAIREKEERKHEDMPQKPPAPFVRNKTPLEKLADIAKGIRGIANQIEEVAIEIEEQAIADREATEKLRQLQALLKGI